MPRYAFRAAVLAALLLTAGCGYRVLGGAGQGGFAGVPEVRYALENFEDLSREPLFGPLVLRELQRRGITRTDFSLERSGGGTLKVVLNGLNEAPRAFNVTNHPTEYLLTAVADAILKKDGKTVGTTTVTATREFAAGTDVGHARANKDAALELLASDLADRLAARIADVGRAKAGEAAK